MRSDGGVMRSDGDVMRGDGEVEVNQLVQVVILK